MTRPPELQAQIQAKAEHMRLVALEDDRLAWERTRNPIYVFEALDHCPADQPLPAWITQYLGKCRAELRGLCFPHGRHPAAKLPPAEATERLLEAFGFRRRPNWNAVEARRQDNIAAGVFFDLGTGANSGTPNHVVIGQVAKRLKVSSRYVRQLRDRAIGLWRR